MNGGANDHRLLESATGQGLFLYTQGRALLLCSGFIDNHSHWYFISVTYERKNLLITTADSYLEEVIVMFDFC